MFAVRLDVLRVGDEERGERLQRAFDLACQADVAVVLSEGWAAKLAAVSPLTKPL